MPPDPRPKVMILIATDDIGGPGKGLFQFLKYFNRDAGDYVLCNFDLKNRPVGQFVEEARRMNLNLQLLKQRFRLDPGLVVRARRLVREHGINIIQTHGHKTHLIGAFLRRFWGTPWIAFSHGYIHGGWKVRLYNWLDRAALAHADRVVAVSESMRALLLSAGVPDRRIRLIYNAIEPRESAHSADRARTAARDAVRRHHQVPPDQQVVGVVGRFSPEKGHLVFLDAMNLVVQQCPNTVALLIGDGEERSRIERYSAENGLARHVILTGYRKDIDDYYRAVDLIVLPSLTEGLPNTILEAMSFGVPVVATQVGGVPEIIDGNNGILVRPNDARSLASAMTALLTDAALRKRLGANGRSSLYPRFSPEHRARQIRQVYQELLATAHE